MQNTVAQKVLDSGSLTWLKKNGSLVALVVIFVGSSLASPYFFSPYNFQNILRQIGVNGILALGLTLVILIGGIDLSIGANLGLIAIVSALLLEAGMSLPVLILAGLLIGTAIGATNGLLITTFGVESWVITLGMQFFLRGICFTLSGGVTLFVDMPPEVDFLANGYVGPIPFPAVILAVFYLAFFLILRYTILGRYLYALGGNEEALRRAGVNHNLFKIVIYAICGATAALGGIINFSRVHVGDPNAGTGLVLFIIGSVIIGGNRFAGGIGGVGYTLIGLLIIMMISNIIVLTGLGYYVQLMAEGGVIITAALLQGRRRG